MRTINVIYLPLVVVITAFDVSSTHIRNVSRRSWNTNYWPEESIDDSRNQDDSPEDTQIFRETLSSDKDLQDSIDRTIRSDKESEMKGIYDAQKYQEKSSKDNATNSDDNLEDIKFENAQQLKDNTTKSMHDYDNKNNVRIIRSNAKSGVKDMNEKLQDSKIKDGQLSQEKSTKDVSMSSDIKKPKLLDGVPFNRIIRSDSETKDGENNIQDKTKNKSGQHYEDSMLNSKEFSKKKYSSFNRKKRCSGVNVLKEDVNKFKYLMDNNHQKDSMPSSEEINKSAGKRMIRSAEESIIKGLDYFVQDPVDNMNAQHDDKVNEDYVISSEITYTHELEIELEPIRKRPFIGLLRTVTTNQTKENRTDLDASNIEKHQDINNAIDVIDSTPLVRMVRSSSANDDTDTSDNDIEDNQESSSETFSEIDSLSSFDLSPLIRIVRSVNGSKQYNDKEKDEKYSDNKDHQDASFKSSLEMYTLSSLDLSPLIRMVRSVNGIKENDDNEDYVNYNGTKNIQEESSKPSSEMESFLDSSLLMRMTRSADGEIMKVEDGGKMTIIEEEEILDMDIAESSLVFRPLFRYRSQVGQKKRVFKNNNNYYNGY